MSARKSSHGTLFLIVSSGSPLALIASSLRSTSKKPFCPMTRFLHPPITACGQRVRFAATWREEFFEVPLSWFCCSSVNMRHYSAGLWQSCCLRPCRAELQHSSKEQLAAQEKRATGD